MTSLRKATIPVMCPAEKATMPAIESAMIEVEKALMADKPDVDKVNGLVGGIMTRYNAALAEVVKDARAR